MNFPTCSRHQINETRIIVALAKAI